MSGCNYRKWQSRQQLQNWLIFSWIAISSTASVSFNEQNVFSSRSQKREPARKPVESMKHYQQGVWHSAGHSNNTITASKCPSKHNQRCHKNERDGLHQTVLFTTAWWLLAFNHLHPQRPLTKARQTLYRFITVTHSSRWNNKLAATGDSLIYTHSPEIIHATKRTQAVSIEWRKRRATCLLYSLE